MSTLKARCKIVLGFGGGGWNGKVSLRSQVRRCSKSSEGTGVGCVEPRAQRGKMTSLTPLKKLAVQLEPCSRPP